MDDHITLLWVGRDYYKRQARMFSRLNEEGFRFLTIEYKEDEVWHSMPAYTHNFTYCMERGLLDE